LKRKLEEVMCQKKTVRHSIEYKNRVPKVIPIEQTPEEKIVYSNMCDLLKTKYFRCSGSQINPRLILFAILPKKTSSSRSAMETLDKIANTRMYPKKLEKWRGIFIMITRT
jgi:hypothetical protein